MIHLIRYLGLRHAWRHKTRTLLTLSGVALGVGLVIAIRTVNFSILESFKKMIESIAGRTTLQVSAGAAGVPEDLWEKLEKAPDVKYVTPIVQQVIRVPEMENATVLILGIDFTGDEQFRDYRFSENEAEVDDPLAFLNDPEAVLISEDFAKRYGKKEGDTFTVLAPGKKQTLKIRGFMKAEGPARAFGGNFMVMDIFAAQAVFGKEGMFDRLDLITSENLKVRDAQESLQKFLGGAYSVEIPRSRGDNAQTLLKSFQIGLNMGGFVALMVALFLIYNTMQIAVTQRRREISIAKALGALRRDVIRLFIGEALFMGAVGSALGILLGLWLAKGLLITVSGAVSMHFLKVNPEGLYLSPPILAFGFFAGIAASAVAAFGPARLAASVSPVEGLRFEGVSASFRPTWSTLNAKIAYGFGAVASTIWLASSHLHGIYWGYACQLASVLALSFLAPTLLTTGWKWIAAVPHRFFPPPERIAFDQLPRQAARAAVTLSAIMLGFGMVVEIDNYIFSFKKTIHRWVDQSIPADLFVTSGSKLARLDNQPMPVELEEQFKSWPEVEAVDKVRMIDVEVDGVTVPLLSNVPEVYLTHVKRDFIAGDKSKAAALMNSGNNIAVAENFLRRFNVQMGDSIRIQTPQGAANFKIIAVVEDYTSDRGLIVMSRKRFMSAFNDNLVDTFDLYLRDKSKTEEVRKRILAQQNKTLEIFVLTNQEMRTEIYRIIDETYKVIKVMEVVAVFVSILGIINTILASVLERTRILGVLRALGTTRFQMVRMVIAEGGYLAVGGMILGLFLGTILTLIIFTMILPESTGWRFDLAIPFARIGVVACAGLLMSILASYLPARHAANLDIVKAIEYE
jgi:putative ABC transport system permease protein